MTTLKNIIILVIVLAGYFILFSYLEIKALNLNGFLDTFDEWNEFVIKPFIISISTLLGILSKYVYDEIEKVSEEKFSIKAVLKKSKTKKSFWLSIIICPAVIGAFYQSISEINSNILIGIIAYQNGFFFKSLFKNDEKK